MSLREIRKSILIAAGAVVVAGAALLAGRLSAGAFHERPRGDFAPRMFARMARALDLSDDQKAKIKDVLRAHAAELTVQLDAHAAARRALHEAMTAQPADENVIRARALELGRIQGDGAVLFAHIRTEVDPILTSDQRQKLQTFKSGMRRHADSGARSLERFLKSD